MQGAERVLVVATSRTGKSVILDDLCERITACYDARLLQVNLSKGVEDAWWARLAEANALASHPEPEAQALRVLDFAVAVIQQRPQWRQVHAPGRRVHQPTEAEPAFIVKIDEVDVVALDPERKAQLEFIASKGGSEAVGLLIAGQRPVNKDIGGAKVRANISQLVWGKMRANDQRQAGGGDAEGITLPSLGAYGGNVKGIFGVTGMPLVPGQPFARGRSFFWGEESQGLIRLIETRARTRAPYHLEPALAMGRAAELWAEIHGTAPAAGAPAAPAAPAGVFASTPASAPGGAPAAPAPGAPVDPRYDLARTRSGQTVPGTAGVHQKLSAAAGAGPEPVSAPKLSAEDETRLQEWQQQRQRFLRRQLPELPPEDQATLRGLLAAPGGVSIRQAAAALPWERTKIHGQLIRWRDEGSAELHGRGSGRKWHAATPPPQAADGAS
jgi:hypothetical protein